VYRAAPSERSTLFFKEIEVVRFADAGSEIVVVIGNSRPEAVGWAAEMKSNAPTRVQRARELELYLDIAALLSVLFARGPST
jgi:hypothetical protein